MEENLKMTEQTCELCKEEVVWGCGDYHINKPACESCEGNEAKDRLYHFHCLVSAYTSKTENENVKLRAKLEFARQLVLDLKQ